MGVTRASIALVALALLVGAQHLDEEGLQSLDGILAKNGFSDEDAELINVTRKVMPTQNTDLKEFEDHAEVKFQTSNSPTIQEEIVTFPVKETTERVEQETIASDIPETLPTPLPNKVEGTGVEVIPEGHIDDTSLNYKNSFTSSKEGDLENDHESGRENLSYPCDLTVPQSFVTFCEQKSNLSDVFNVTASLSMNLSFTEIETPSNTSVSGGHQKNVTLTKVPSNQGVTDSKMKAVIIIIVFCLFVLFIIGVGYIKLKIFESENSRDGTTDIEGLVQRYSNDY